MKETKEYLENLLQEDDVVVLALSGGPDSMCLLDFLMQVKKNIHIICAHVNHHTRKENDSEYQFIKEYTQKRNLILEYHEITSYQKGRFTEAEARDKRYAFLKDVCNKYHANYLMTAHHADDLVETILMRMLRGSSLQGYAGFSRVSNWDDICMVRPFITMTKKEILSYLEEQKIPYVTDESNTSQDYLRNRIRSQILPVIMEEEESYPKRFLDYSNTLKEASIVLSKKTEESLNEVLKDNRIEEETFFKYSEEEQKLILKMYFHRIYGNSINRVEDKHINLCRDFMKTKKNSYLHLPGKKRFYHSCGYSWIEEQKEKQEYYIELKEKHVLPNEDQIVKLDEYHEKSNFEIHLNSQQITLPLYVTTRKDGMKMEVKNLHGTRKVNDIFIDKKIPREKRDEIPILVDAKGTVLWILGVSKSKYDVLKEEKYDIIYKYVKKGGKK